MTKFGNANSIYSSKQNYEYEKENFLAQRIMLLGLESEYVLLRRPLICFQESNITDIYIRESIKGKSPISLQTFRKKPTSQLLAQV